MIEKKLSEIGSSKNIILNLMMDEYFIFEKIPKNNRIVGLYTPGVATCSVIIISINNDEKIFFSHIQEKSNIYDIIVHNFMPKLKNIKINKIEVIYSKGFGSLKNPEKENKIEEILNLFDNFFKIDKIIKEHDSILSCLKIINIKENQILFENIINFQSNLMKKSTKFIKNISDNFLNSWLKENILRKENVIFYLEPEKLENIKKRNNLLII